MIISFYKFTPIKNPIDLRATILEKARDLEIKGTILLALEGINGMVSGCAENIGSFQSFLCHLQDLGHLEFKGSYYESVSFRRILVKVKKEIISLRQDVDPLKETGSHLDPLEFKKWMDESKDIHVLDTRNNYEFALGSFKNARNPNIKSFEEFALYIDKNVDFFKSKPTVTFCTGGIRCEKATAYMLKKGIKDVYQLEGGILKYFEKTSSLNDKQWQGECVVFDKRKAITSELKPSTKMICYICLAEMNNASKAIEDGLGGQQCKSCLNKKNQSRAARITRKLSRKKNRCQ